jgi:uncharacterized membrane protein YeaQ/YmgE (transglycosylase-associated protein family)
LQEIALEVVAYLRASPVLFTSIALVAGIAADRTVAYERRSGVVLFTLIGLMGLFSSQFALLFFGLQEYLDKVAEFRILFDLLAAYIGAFFVAAIIHFIRPT